jgi:DNA-directed RNA polymerase specialized sigma24 family protein
MHVVQGYYFHGKDFRALAKELGKSVAAIHSLHFHALNDLRAQLELERVEYE